LAVVSATTALAVAGATPASADEFAAQDSGGLVARDRGAETGRAAVLEALERDLGLSPTEAGELFDSQPAAVELDEELEAQLGASFGGSWLDQETGTLTVAVTDSGAARLARTAGAETELVAHSEPELRAITDDLDALAEADPEAMAVATSWGIDAPANQVMLTVREGQASELAPLVAQYGDAVRIEESAYQPTLMNHPFLDGGMPYSPPVGGCSVGFNVRNPSTGVGFFLTAGHCHSQFGASSSHGIAIGPAVGRRLSGADDALVRNDNPGQWVQGPWISTHSGSGFITVRGQADPPAGTAICKSGRTTLVTCGTVTLTGETVTFSSGNTVDDLTRHDACTEGGDSGGATYTAAGTLGVGTHIGGFATDDDRCLAVIGQQNIAWYQPLNRSLPAYEPLFGIQLMTG
jgi:streptogrisin C